MKQTRLALDVVQVLFAGKKCLLLVDPVPDESKCALPEFYEAVRGTKLARNSVLDTPGTLLAADQGDWLGALLALSLYFSWEACVLDGFGSLLFHVDMDGRYAAKALDAEYESIVRDFMA